MTLSNTSVQDISADINLIDSKSKIKANFDDLLENDQGLDTRTSTVEGYFSKVKLTPEGGIAVKFTNKTGTASVKGTIVRASTVTDNAFMVAPASSDEPIGVVYENGISDGLECWVIVSGIAEVLLKDGTASTRGNWIEMSDVAGRADATNTDPLNTTAHWNEIGHCIESHAAGTNVLCKAVLHFN